MNEFDYCILGLIKPQQRRPAEFRPEREFEP